ncbi:MAG: hypothetical protein WCP24_01600 [bacterium]
MSDQNKQQNKLDETKDKVATLSISDITVFKDNPHLIYLYKKTEKLVSALYLLSSFISDREPIKWQMREEGVNLLSQSLCLSDRLSSERMLAYTKFISTGLKFLSFLEVSYLGGIISEMNYSVLKYEFETLIKTAESGEKGGENKGLIFPEHFFEVQSDQVDESLNILSKGHTLMSDRPARPLGGMSVKKTVETVRTSELKQKDKSNRQEVIINLLKKNSELGIKDFTLSIKDCSEKTIQRELVLLVSKGLIKKAGEKRWSKYSIKA